MTSSTTSDSGVVKSGLQNYNKKRSVYMLKIRDKPTEFKNSIVHRRTLFVQYFTSTAFYSNKRRLIKFLTPQVRRLFE